jgi:hypothetical protein
VPRSAGSAKITQRNARQGRRGGRKKGEREAAGGGGRAGGAAVTGTVRLPRSRVHPYRTNSDDVFGHPQQHRHGQQKHTVRASQMSPRSLKGRHATSLMHPILLWCRRKSRRKSCVRRVWPAGRLVERVGCVFACVCMYVGVFMALVGPSAGRLARPALRSSAGSVRGRPFDAADAAAAPAIPLSRASACPPTTLSRQAALSQLSSHLDLAGAHPTTTITTTKQRLLP